MRRDAKAAGPDAAAHLKEVEKPANNAVLMKLHDDWQTTVGPASEGTVRIGVFDWAQCTVHFAAEQGTADQGCNTMNTHKEVIDIFEKRDGQPVEGFVR